MRFHFFAEGSLILLTDQKKFAESVVSELQFLGLTAQTAFGVIGDGQFEEIFVERI